MSPPKKAKVTGRNAPPSLSQIMSDDVMKLADKFWLGGLSEEAFQPKLVEVIYEQEMRKTAFAAERIMYLEYTRYLENYLWPHYTAESTLHHVISVAALINEKFREGVPPWACVTAAPDHFSAFFARVLEILAEEEGKEDSMSFRERTQLLVFLSHALSTVEVDLVRDEMKQLVGLSSWSSLSEAQRERRFADFPKLRKLYAAVKKKEAKLEGPAADAAAFKRDFLWTLLGRMKRLLLSLPLDAKAVSEEAVGFLERFVELLIGLESSLLSRRFFDAVLEASLFIPRAELSVLGLEPAEEGPLVVDRGHLFRQLLQLLAFYRRFEMDESGQALTATTTAQRHYARIAHLQKAVFKHFPEKMKSFYLSNIGSIDQPDSLKKHLSPLSCEELVQMCDWLDLLGAEEAKKDKDFLLNVLIGTYGRRESQLQKLLEMPLYPTEADIWNENKIPNDFVNGEKCFAAPKLNLQFLTIQDYLYRNFELFLDEATYEIRQDLEDAVGRMKPWAHESDEGEVVWGGWARMALPVQTFSVVEVSKPRIGERAPSSVRADVALTLGRRSDVRGEWEALRKHDVCFLLTVKPKLRVGTPFDIRTPFLGQVDILAVRGCEIEGMLGPDGKLIEDFGPDSGASKPKIPGDGRTWRVWMDPNQYYVDMEASLRSGKADVYDTFNVIIRRNPKENNFKSVLETIRQLLATKCVVPDWLEELLLGYGAPNAAHYSKMKNRIAEMDFNDTFLDMEHLKASFPNADVECAAPTPVPPFRLARVREELQACRV